MKVVLFSQCIAKKIQFEAKTQFIVNIIQFENN